MNAYTSNYSYAINGDIRFYLQFFRTSATFLPVIFMNADLNASYNIVQSGKLGILKSYGGWGVITVTSLPPHQHASRFNISSHREPYYQPLNKPRRSSLMSHDQRARDCRLRVFLHIMMSATCKTRTAVHYIVSCLNTTVGL